MKQILQSLKNGKCELAEVPVPMVKPGHVLIRTAKSLISIGTEKMLVEFGKAGWIDKARQQPDRVKQVLQKMKTDGIGPTVNAVFNKLDQPLPMGYSNVGVVLEVGSGVSTLSPGDRVVSNGNHAEIVCIPEHLCARVPEGVDDVTASFTVVSAIALQGVRLINPTIGEHIAVVGLGLIGLLTCQILRANGCRVIGFDFDHNKVDLARKLGAEAHVPGTIDTVQTALAFSGGEGVDGVIITAATRSNDPIHEAPTMCRKRGRVVLVGVVGLEISRDDFYKKEISFQVSCSYGPGRYDAAYEKKGLDYPIGFVRWTENRNFLAILRLMQDQSLTTRQLVTRVVPFGEAVSVYEELGEDPGALGIVLDYDGKVDTGRRQVRLIPECAPPEAGVPVIGCIGAGNYANSTLIPALRDTGVHLRTIASSGGVSGTHLGRKSGFEISTTEYGAIMRDEMINTVVITTQHDTHARLVIEALEAGKHVFVEKPLCMTRAELDQIIKVHGEIGTRKKLLLMVGFNRRFSPLTETMKRLLGPITDPKAFIMTVNAGMIPADHWTQDADTGGGRIIGEACHFIDLLRFLAGSPIDKVQTTFMVDPKLSRGLPDTATINLTFQDGSIGSIHYFANGNKGFPKERLEVFAAGKILRLDNFTDLAGFGWERFNGEKLWSQDKGHHGCLKAFAQAIKLGKPAPIPFSELVEIADITLRSAGSAS